MHKLLTLGLSGLVSVGLAGAMTSRGPDDDPEPPPKKGSDPKKSEAAKKGDAGPAGDLRKAYDLLRRIKVDDSPPGRSDERLRDWTDRAAQLYRQGVDAQAAGDARRAHEYGTAAHDLSRAVDHVRNASRFDRPDPDLPAPPAGPTPGADGAEARRDLRHAYDRIRRMDGEGVPEAAFYLDAARDLYNAARRDATADRHERARELARAAEALTHVPEHLAHIASPDAEPQGDRERPEPKAKKGEGPEPKAKKGDGPEPKAKKGEGPADEDRELPPPLPTRG